MTTPSGRAHCDACFREIHDPVPAQLLSRPDLSRRVRRYIICRTCTKRVLESFPQLRARARQDSDRGRRAA